VTWFEGVVDEYDAARPTHPGAIYDALEPLSGARVLDVGCGTGIATRELLARGALVTAVDLGPQMLARALARSPGLPGVLADGAHLPVAGGSVDLLCFAQSWHWLDPERRIGEARRVLTPDGRWAAWWTHARADGEVWYDASWDLIEAACPGVHRSQRDTDWGADVEASGRFDVGPRVTVAWTREMPIAHWLVDAASRSHIATLPDEPRAALLDGLRSIVTAHAGDGPLQVPCETWLWVATAT